jgi:hypothetical protein
VTELHEVEQPKRGFVDLLSESNLASGARRRSGSELAETTFDFEGDSDNEQ